MRQPSAMDDRAQKTCSLDSEGARGFQKLEEHPRRREVLAIGFVEGSLDVIS